MTKLKKTIITACAAVSVFAAGAACVLLPEGRGVDAAAKDTVSASAEASYWKQVPHISGWTWEFQRVGKSVYGGSCRLLHRV